MTFLFLNSARQWGGNENWILLAADALRAHNQRVIIAYRSEQVGSRYSKEKIKLPFYSEVDVITLLRLFKLIKYQHVDIIISTKQKEYFIGGFLARFCGIKNILRLGIVRRLQNTWSKRLIYDRLCDGIIVNARTIKEVLCESSFIKPGKIIPIYNGVDIRDLHKKSEQIFFKKSFSFLIVSSGMLIKRKGFDLLLRAFAAFKHSPDGKDAGLLLLGDGEERENLQRLSRELQIDRVTVFQRYRENPFPYIKQADCFILLSENEGIPNALIEAMAFRLPVITAPSGGINEIITDGENGFIVKRNDENLLINRLRQLKKDPSLRRRLGGNAYLTVNKQFNTGRMAEQIIQFCEKTGRKQ